MSGVKNKVQAENKGLKQVTNEDLKDDGISSPSEMSEGYGEEKHEAKK